MKHDALPTVYGVFSEKWPDFQLKKSKRTWIKKTEDRIMLLIHLQASKWGAMYYLNFGAYFLEIDPIDKPLSNLPKSSDWHLFARYESFRELPTKEQNILFSLEERDATSLESRCTEIAVFAEKTILPQLRTFGIRDLIKDHISKRGLDMAFNPFHLQRIANRDILNYALKQSGP